MPKHLYLTSPDLLRSYLWLSRSPQVDHKDTRNFRKLPMTQRAWRRLAAMVDGEAGQG